MLAANDVAAVVIARNGPWIDSVSLQKLLYYIQAWHLAVTDRPLFEEKIKAWKQGPVVPQVWHARKEKSTRRAVDQDVDSIQLDPDTSDLIDLVLASYGSMTGDELSALTHVEAPWLDARGDLPEDANCNTAIEPESMARFYRAHRKLGGRSAADLAAGGIHLRSAKVVGSVDVDAILSALGDDLDDLSDDPWGGANLDLGSGFDADGIEYSPRRAHADF